MHDIQEYWNDPKFEAGNQISNKFTFITPFIENYLQLVNILEDAVLVIKKEKAEESKKSE